MALDNEQLTQQLQQLAAAFQASQNQLAEARQGLATQVEAIHELQRQLASTNDQLASTNDALVDTRNRLELAEARPRTEGVSMIDKRGLAKPSPFDSSKPGTFPDWSFKFVNFVVDAMPSGDEVLEWARAQEEQIDLEQAALANPECTDVLGLSTSMCTALNSLL